MGWVRLDDNFADHLKVIALSDSAFRLFITGLCYSNRQLTDGFLSYQIVATWVGDNPTKPSDELEENNLWRRADKGFFIRSYDEYQPSREQVTEKRNQGKARLERFRQKRSADETEMKRVSGAFQERFGNGNETVTPTQPNPTQPNKDISTTPSEFSAFWDIYPRKVGKANASKAFTKALGKVPASTILEGAERLANDPNLDLAYCPHPTTWLNGERWTDEELPSKSKKPAGLAILQGMRNERIELA